MKDSFISYVDLSKQWKDERKDLLSLLDKALSKGTYVGGDQVLKFEKNIAKFLNVKYPRRKNVKGCKLGTGTKDGQNAASNVGLDAQTTGSKPQLALKGY